MITNTIYFSGAVLFLMIAINALRARPELRRKNKFTITVAITLWTVFWPLAAACVLDDIIPTNGRKKT